MTNTWDKCKNCGGEYGIHHWQTQQCPFGGVEAGPNRPDTWVSTQFEIDDSDDKSRIAALEAQNAELQNRIIAFEQAVTEDEREDKDRIAELVKALGGLMTHFVGDRNSTNLMGDAGLAADFARSTLESVTK